MEKIVLVDSEKGWSWTYFLKYKSGAHGIGNIYKLGVKRYKVSVPGLAKISRTKFKTKKAAETALRIHIRG